MKKAKIIFGAILVASLCGCSNQIDEEHQHVFSETWAHSDTQHWHPATCGHDDVKDSLSDHTYDKNGKCTVCGFKKPALIRENVKEGENKDSATLNEYYLYSYSNGVLATKERYYCNGGEEKLTSRTIYNKYSDVEEDTVIYNFNGDKINDIRHQNTKYNEKGALIYELDEHKDKEEDPYRTSIEVEYLITYDDQGRETSNIVHYKTGSFYILKTTFTYDNLGRLVEKIEEEGHGEQIPSVLESDRKYIYSYVGDTSYIAVCDEYHFSDNEFKFSYSEHFSYNENMFLTKIEKFDEDKFNHGLTEITYEGNKVTMTKSRRDEPGDEFKLDEINISEYSTNYFEGITNPISTTMIEYDGSSTPDDKEISYYTYTSTGDLSFVEEYELEPKHGEMEVYGYTATEYVYEN